MKIILDTDIGSDCDDAVCLAYLLLRDDCDLLGVTTVGPNAATRANIVRKLCQHFGRPDIAVLPGASQPLLPNPYWPGHHVNQHTILDQPDDRPDDPPPADAVDFLRRAIHQNPGEVVLLTVGPATNAGLLAMTDPPAMADLQALYAMGGRFHQPQGHAPRGECNAMLDPAAFAAILAAPTPKTFIAGVEVTGKTSLSRPQVQSIFAGDRLAIIRDCVHACALGFGKDLEHAGTGMHDPFTAACIFHPEFAPTTRQGRAAVRFQHEDFNGKREFTPEQVTGHTPFHEDPRGPHLLAGSADVPAYHQHVDEVFARARLG